MRRYLAVMVTAAVVLGAAAVWAAPQEVLLELKGEQGQELRYETTLAMEMDFQVKDPGTGRQVVSVAPRLEGSATTIARVAEVAENGDLTLASRVESFDISLEVADLHARLAITGPGGGPPELIKLPELPVKSIVSKRGALVAIEGLDRLPIPPIPGPGGTSINLPEIISKMVTDFSQPEFPDRPVAVGDTWEWEVVIDPMAMAEMMGAPMPPEAKEQMEAMKFPMRCTYRLAGFEEVNGVECARIEAEVPWELTMAPEPSVMLKESGTTKVVTWFDYAAGRPVKESTEVGFSMKVEAEQATVVSMEMRVEAGTELK